MPRILILFRTIRSAVPVVSCDVLYARDHDDGDDDGNAEGKRFTCDVS